MHKITYSFITHQILVTTLLCTEKKPSGDGFLIVGSGAVMSVVP
jgi:hypothetical protein